MGSIAMPGKAIDSNIIGITKNKPVYTYTCHDHQCLSGSIGQSGPVTLLVKVFAAEFCLVPATL